MNHTCKICNESFSTSGKLSSHIRFIHKMPSYDYSLKYDYNGIIPLCKCGCGQQTSWINLNKGFSEYVQFHSNKLQTKIPRKTINCKNCNKELEVKINSKIKFCSPKCQYEYRTKEIKTEIRICPNCKSEFKVKINSPKKYCSKECSRLDVNMWNKMKETIEEKYGEDNIFKTKLFKEEQKRKNLELYDVEYSFQRTDVKEKSKNTKKEKYGNKDFNNRLKYKETCLERYDAENYLHSNDWFKRKSLLVKKIKETTQKKKKQSFRIIPSKDEMNILNNLEHATGSFIYENKEFDIKINDNIYEIDGIFYHPNKLENLSIIQINSAINDFEKTKIIEQSNYSLYRIRAEQLKAEINEETLQLNSYRPDYSISYYQKIISKEYFKRYIDKKGKDKLIRYIPLLFKFIRTFQPEFPYLEQTEKLSEVIATIQNYDLNRIYKDKIFRNNISPIGNNYLKSNFKSYWNSSYSGNLTPVQAWYENTLLQDVIKYRIGCNDSNEIFDFSLHQLIRGLSARRITISFFKPLLAASIYQELLKDKINPIVIDPCAGFGGRLLGFMSKYPEGTYIGIEPNKDTFQELLELRLNLIEELKLNENQIQLYNCKFEDFRYEKEYNLVFTSIPFFETEIYSDNIKYESFEEWQETFIKKFYSFNNVYLNMSSDLMNKLELKEEFKILNNTSHFNKKSNQKYEVICKI